MAFFALSLPVNRIVIFIWLFARKIHGILSPGLKGVFDAPCARRSLCLRTPSTPPPGEYRPVRVPFLRENAPWRGDSLFASRSKEGAGNAGRFLQSLRADEARGGAQAEKAALSRFRRSRRVRRPQIAYCSDHPKGITSRKGLPGQTARKAAFREQKSARRLLANLPASDGRRRPLECQSYLAAVHFASGNPFLRVTVDSLKVFRPESRPDVHKTEGDARGGGFPVRQPAKPRSANKKAPGGSLRAFRRFPSFSFRPLSRPPAPPCPRH